MWFEALVEVHHACYCRSNRDDQQKQCQNCESRERAANRNVVVLARGCVHSNELEDEVGHCREVYDDDADLSDVGFAAGKVCGEEEKDDGDGDGGDGEVEFRVGGAGDDDDELDGEAEEEEEVELEERDVDLE